MDYEELNEEGISINFTGDKLLAEFKKIFNKNLKNIEKAVNAFDSEETGFIAVDDWRKILHSFCFLLTDCQFQEILKCSLVVNNKIFYPNFINHFKKSHFEDEEKWALCVKKLTAASNTKKKLENEEVVRHVKEAVKSHKENFIQEFKDQDFCNLGTARQEVLRKLLQKYVFRLSDEQFNNLWEKLPRNEIGLLKYQEFMDEWNNGYNNKTNISRASSSISLYSSPASRRTRPSTPVSSSKRDRPKTANSITTYETTSSVKSSFRPKSAASSHFSTATYLTPKAAPDTRLDDLKLKGLSYSVLTNQQYKQFRELDYKNENLSAKSRSSSLCKSTSSNIFSEEGKTHQAKTMRSETPKSKIVKCELPFINDIKVRWRDILRRCKAIDTEKQDLLVWNDFIDILQKTGIIITPEVEQQFCSQFNIKLGFPVNYWIFLRNIVLNNDSLIVDIKNQNAQNALHDKNNKNGDGAGLSKALLKINDKIVKNGRDLRHTFRKTDKDRTGFLRSLDFRKILALYKIYLSEEDFFYIQDYFDPKLTENINYVEFLKHFA